MWTAAICARVIVQLFLLIAALEAAGAKKAATLKAANFALDESRNFARNFRLYDRYRRRARRFLVSTPT